jgi:simple sugar transport system permease protein
MNKISKILLDEQKQSKFIPFLSILLGFIIGAIVMLLSGNNPIEAYLRLIEGAGLFGDIKRFGNTLLIMTTLILTGLSVSFAFRTGLFNIGAAGQMLMGGFVATYIGIVYSMPKVLHLTIAVVFAMIAGAIWAIIPGLLKAKYKIHEVVTTIMMNWIAVWSVYYLVPVLIKGKYDTESLPIKDTASLRTSWLSNLFNHSNVNIGLFLAIIAAIIIWIILEKTTFGYELKAVGFNEDAAQYAGIKVNRNIILSMMISGALAGLAGATFYLGYTDNIKISVLPSQGFDGIAVALLGVNSPIGVVFSAFLFGIMNAGKGFMQSSTNVPHELVPIIMGTIIFFAATNQMIKGWINKLGKHITKKDGGNN